MVKWITQASPISVNKHLLSNNHVPGILQGPVKKAVNRSTFLPSYKYIYSVCVSTVCCMYIAERLWQLVISDMKKIKKVEECEMGCNIFKGWSGMAWLRW